MSIKVLVTGARGQLGTDLMNELKKQGIEGIGVDIDEMDITDAKQVQSVIGDGNYDAVVHCAAWTAVDKAEEAVELVNRVNVDGTKNIADVCAKLDIPMMYFSTDYVFDGQGSKPWKEDDEANPLNVYGESKYGGELVTRALTKHFIIRISWVFGRNGNNFIKTMLKLGKERGSVSVVDDQFGSPTYTYDLAKLVVDMIQSDKYGTYHATNQGICSWYEFACEIFKQAGMTVEVNPVDSSAFPVAAKRPHNSRMEQSELDRNGFKRLPDWQDALARYLVELGK